MQGHGRVLLGSHTHPDRCHSQASTGKGGKRMSQPPASAAPSQCSPAGQTRCLLVRVPPPLPPNPRGRGVAKDLSAMLSGQAVPEQTPSEPPCPTRTAPLRRCGCPAPPKPPPFPRTHLHVHVGAHVTINSTTILDRHSGPWEQTSHPGPSHKAQKPPRPSPGLPQPSSPPPRPCVASLGFTGSGLRGLCWPEVRDGHHSRSRAPGSQMSPLLESPTAQPHQGPRVAATSKLARSRSQS